jgi:hypothetical protein
LRWPLLTLARAGLGKGVFIVARSVSWRGGRRWLAVIAAALAACGVAGTVPSAVLASSAPASASWVIQPTPPPAGSTFSQLLGVSCSSSAACTAVGDYFTNSAGHVLAERWEGGAWTIQPTPDLASSSASLLGVSCWSAVACIAVGNSTPTASPSQVLAEAWNGTKWNIQSIPRPPGARSSLRAVSCSSSGACTAIGSVVAERWNGTKWRIQSIPKPPGTRLSLAGVSCPSSTACTAVGTYLTSSNHTRLLAERWNGMSWAIQPVPAPAGSFLNLPGVSCSSPTACTAVGGYENSSGIAKVLAERWNGTKWTIQSAPDPVGNAALAAVSCWSSRECTAVGSYVASHVGKVLAERWNGTSWTIQPAPNPQGEFPALNSVSCPAADACTAAGGTNPKSATHHQTLVERNAS